MDCPKCGHRQDGTVRCDACGVYFAKLQQPTVRSEPVAGEAPPRAARGGSFGAGALVVTAVAVGGAVYAVMRHAAPPTAKPDVEQPTAPAATAPLRSTTDAPASTVPRSADARPPAVRQRNPVEAARRATVFIRTEWGLGSGVIVDSDCHVITNRHVVETDGQRVAGTVLRDPEMRSRLVAAEQNLRASLARDLRLRSALQGQPGTNMEQVQLDERIRSQRAALEDMTGQLSRSITTTVEDASRKGFTATLVDGTEFRSLHATLSDRHDLAMFRLPANNCPFVSVGRSGSLTIGERVYTVGNPSGITYTVTSGVFSGERQIDQRRYLQTDAPISPGNSGGPLITETGEVVGINTLVLRGVPGVGFAIPIEFARDEFLGR